MEKIKGISIFSRELKRVIAKTVGLDAAADFFSQEFTRTTKWRTPGNHPFTGYGA